MAEGKQFEWTDEVEKATAIFVKNLSTVHHPNHSVKVVIRAAESILAVAEHDEGVQHLARLGLLEATVDLQKYSDDIIILKNCAGLLLTMVTREGSPLRKEVGTANAKAIAEIGGLEAIVKLGSSKDPVIKIRTLKALCFMVSFPELHQKMADVGIVPVLAAITHDVSERADILEFAVDAMGALCFTHATATQVAGFGGVANLVELLRSESSTVRLRETTFVGVVGLATCPLEEVQYKAAGALRDLAVNDEYKREIARFKGIPPLVELVRSGTEEIQGQAAAAIINNEGGVAALASRLRSSSVKLQTQAVGALWNLTREPECVKCMVELEIWPQLLHLAHSPTPEVRELAVGVVRSLALQDANIRKEVVKASKHSVLHQDTTLDCNTGGRFLEPEIFSWN